MKKVYKYPVPIEDVFKILMPKGAEILSVQSQRGDPQIWALVDPLLEATEERLFRFAGTGHQIVQENLKYIGSFQNEAQTLIFHIFEIVQKEK